MTPAAPSPERRDRREGGASLRRLVEQMPALLWWTDAELTITASMGGALPTFGKDETVAVPHGDEYGRTIDMIVVHRDLTAFSRPRVEGAAKP